MSLAILFRKLDGQAIEPRRAYDHDAGWDLFALEDTVISDFKLTWVRTGIAVAIPDGYYGRVVGRSSAASRGLHVVEGVIDAGYRGEQMMRAIVSWEGDGKEDPKLVRAGESLAQLIIQPVVPVMFYEVGELPPSERGERGYGSSGHANG